MSQLLSSLTPSAVNYVKNFFGENSVTIPASLFYREEGWSVGDVPLDLILEEEHSIDASVTEHPVQDGSVVSDHVYVHLRSGSLRALVSNHSINATDVYRNAEGDEEDFAQAAQEGGGLYNWASETWTLLKNLVDNRKPVTIVTALEVYDNVLVTHVDTARDGETGDALEFVINFQQFKQVKLREDRVTAEVTQSDMKSDTNREAAPQLYQGQVVAPEASPDQKSQLGG